MPQSLVHIALIVRDYDEAIAWFTEKLGFALVADEHQPEQDTQAIARRSDSAAGPAIAPTGKRWVLVAPPGAGENAFAHARPARRIALHPQS